VALLSIRGTICAIIALPLHHKKKNSKSATMYLIAQKKKMQVSLARHKNQTRNTNLFLPAGRPSPTLQRLVFDLNNRIQNLRYSIALTPKSSEFT
jgi:hypothetical protein